MERVGVILGSGIGGLETMEKEMANIQAGMGFYGEMPDMFNLVLNSDHKLIKEVLDVEEKACGESIATIRKEMEGINMQRDSLKKVQEGKKPEDISATEKEQLHELDGKLDDLKKQKDSLLVEQASQNKTVHQLIDLALLQNGMLKGESLNNFIKRSIDLIG